MLEMMYSQLSDSSRALELVVRALWLVVFRDLDFLVEFGRSRRLSLSQALRLLNVNVRPSLLQNRVDAC